MVERILIDNQFLSIALEKATTFFLYGILPELLGKWYSKLPDYAIQSSEDDNPELLPDMLLHVRMPQRTGVFAELKNQDK